MISLKPKGSMYYKKLMVAVFLLVLSKINIAGPVPEICKVVIATELHDTTTTQEEKNIKETVFKFLKFAGNYQIDSMAAMLVPEATLGIARFKNDKWNTYVYTFSEFLKTLKSSVANPYVEKVSTFTVYIESGQLAFVKANATLYRNGKANSHNVDYFTLIKMNDAWKFINVSFTVIPSSAK